MTESVHSAAPAPSLTKHHGLGNDFLIAVDPGRAGARLPNADDAVAWCDRHVGIGADGLILATPVRDTAGSTEAASLHDGPVRRWRMVLWNADGSRAEISGNGIRCLGQAIAQHLQLDDQVDQDLLIETDAGTRTLTIKARSQEDPADTAWVRAGMGKAVDGPEASRRWAEAGVAIGEQRGVDIGNPHLVAFVPELSDQDMSLIGPVIEADYPAGLNVHLVEVVDRDHIRMRIWERGAGVTQACGSGACAAAWVANSAGRVGPLVQVEMPGGAASVELTDDEIFLIGPAVRVAEVIVNG